MNVNQDYEKDLATIRQIMERSSKFLSLSGWSGILAGTYALFGVLLAFLLFNYQAPTWLAILNGQDLLTPHLNELIWLALSILALTLITVVILATNKAKKRGETAWNATSKRLLFYLGVPLLAGGLVLLVLLLQGLSGLLLPLSLLFYGLALFTASSFTFAEMKYLGMSEMLLGLIGLYFIEYSLVCWAMGFGLLHVGYGLYLHFSYER